MKNKKLKILLLILGLFGFTIFFPVRLSNDKCCIGEKLIHWPENRIEINRTYFQLTQKYVVPYGLLWWFSIALTFGNIKLLIPTKKVEKNEYLQKSDF